MVLAAVLIMKETPEFIRVFNFQPNNPYQQYGEPTPVIPYLKEYQIIQFGFQLQIFILHLIKKKKSTFYEMLLHHLATIILIANQYLLDQLLFGSIILFLHDISDFCLFLCRICNDFKVQASIYSKLIMALFLTSWLVTRLIIFPINVIYPTIVYCFSNLNNDNITIRLGCTCFSFQTLLLTLLFFMHIYWFILFVRIVYYKLAKK